MEAGTAGWLCPFARNATSIAAITNPKRQTMSIEALAALIQRASDDADFRRQLQFDPRQALQSVDLTTAEFNALKSGSAAKLRELGLDEALSKQGARVRLSPTLR